ncbi:ankyrin repeat and SOCS box protein 11 [Pangasianodon hypophthalmus]|uniref:ankyrin repeat and SOCS box protein 11 n=1 Tax=Pangasianodon hypophthalmus TaxID=310915 RepID=UPI000F001B42|nr:ankyrin repeat and SOCS box protein 11 [Pangasianodon hypophthalmus]
MAAAHAEVCVWNEPWQQVFRVYGGWVCNTLMEGSCADRTPLHDAALQGRLLSLKKLLSQGMHVGVATLDGITPLHEACLGGHFACAKLLLEHGADANAVSVDGATPLFNSCLSGNTALLQVLLKHSSVHHPAHLRNSPIHVAAKQGHTACVELLLSYGMDADMELDEAGTPLYCACETRSTECVQRLLILGADVQCGRGLDTPLHAAVRVGGSKEVALLLEHGADVKCRNSEGKTPLDLATDNGIQHLLQTAGPRSLSQMSRLCIRRSLGQKRLNRARVLQLPHILHNYILYQ